MRKVIRKRIRLDRSGLNVAADLDAAIAINTGRDAEASHTVARSSHTVAQGVAGQRDQPDEPPSDPSGPPEEAP